MGLHLYLERLVGDGARTAVELLGGGCGYQRVGMGRQGELGVEAIAPHHPPCGMENHAMANGGIFWVKGALEFEGRLGIGVKHLSLTIDAAIVNGQGASPVR
jgi:hypothetical protein